MEVLHVEYFPLARFKPSGSSRSLALRTMPVATRVVNKHLVLAALTAFEMASQSGRPANRQSI
jgi:hypothetical protein